MSASFATLVLMTGPRRPHHVLLATFLFLIAANQGAETMRALASSALERTFWFRVATVCAAFDPFVLAWAFSLTPAGASMHRLRVLLPILITGGALALGATLTIRTVQEGRTWLTFLLAVYTAVIYTTLAFVALRPALVPDAPPSTALTFAALLVVALPPWASVVWDMTFVLFLDPLRVRDPFTFPWVAFGDFVIVVIVLGLFVAAMRRSRSSTQTRARFARASLAALVIYVVLDTFHIAQFVSMMLPLGNIEGFVLVGRSGAPLRWLLFGALMSVVMLRDETFATSLRERRRAARLLISLALLAGAATIIATIQAFMGSSPIDPVVLGVLVLAVALSQGFRGLVDRVASKAYAVPLAADMAGRHEYYRSAVALTQRQGRSPRHDPELVRLRAELELDDATAFALERSADMANDGPLIIGQLVGARYQILRALGRGGSGRVFLARDELLQRDVALKEVPIEGGDEAALWEARLAGSIHHPNVVSVYDVLQRPGTWVLVTEHVESGSLADRIARPPQLETSEAIMILDGILAGLAAVHEKGVIHRDLKPGNVLLASTGQPKLADFGIAGRGDDHTVDLASGRPTFGTPGYASPEQSRGERSRVASDIYAVGMIGQAILPSPLPLHIAPIIECALDEDPAARWPDARSMRDALLVASTVPVTS